MAETCYLLLENGDAYEGERFGAAVDTVGELVFTTGVVGCVQTLTDPSYYGQIIMQTFPLIGNYGMIEAEQESPRCFARGYVAREWCEKPSNFRMEGTVDAFLKAQGVPGVCGVDTRQITRVIRDKGVMNAAICAAPTDELVGSLRAYRVKGAVAGVSGAERVVYAPEGAARKRIVLIDYGAKKNIVRELVRRGCEVTCVPHDTPASEILAMRPDGLMLSNGPGDPAENEFEILQLVKLVGKLPIFGICLGHQLLALACGAKTAKLKYGHRGANQPVKRLCDGRMFITCQNHGYAVVSDTLPKGALLDFVNANDQTCEGVMYPELRAMSAQFHPEACSGPRDAMFLFDDFLAMTEGGCAQCR